MSPSIGGKNCGAPNVTTDVTCFVTASGRKVDLGIYVEHGKERLAAYAMDALKRSMRWDEEAFGREYDLDIFMIVAVEDYNMVAMENKWLKIFNSSSGAFRQRMDLNALEIRSSDGRSSNISRSARTLDASSTMGSFIMISA